MPFQSRPFGRHHFHSERRSRYSARQRRRRKGQRPIYYRRDRVQCYSRISRKYTDGNQYPAADSNSPIRLHTKGDRRTCDFCCPANLNSWSPTSTGRYPNSNTKANSRTTDGSCADSGYNTYPVARTRSNTDSYPNSNTKANSRTTDGSCADSGYNTYPVARTHSNTDSYPNCHAPGHSNGHTQCFP